LIGDISDVIKKSLIKAKYSKKILELGKSKMLDIVKTAYENTPSGGVVILSPGTSSFDMFENYKVRGIEFKKAFLSLRKTFNLKK
jgi:UDP-N-acetylmuramoylalanine--D-glutamate ligase